MVRLPSFGWTVAKGEGSVITATRPGGDGGAAVTMLFPIAAPVGDGGGFFFPSGITDTVGNAWSVIPGTNLAPASSGGGFQPCEVTAWWYTTGPILVGTEITVHWSYGGSPTAPASPPYTAALALMLKQVNGDLVTTETPFGLTGYGQGVAAVTAGNCMRWVDSWFAGTAYPAFSTGPGIILNVSQVPTGGLTYTPDVLDLYDTFDGGGQVMAVSGLGFDGSWSGEPGGCWSGGAGLEKAAMVAGLAGQHPGVPRFAHQFRAFQVDEYEDGDSTVLALPDTGNPALLMGDAHFRAYLPDEDETVSP